MNITLIRHGKTKGNLEHRYIGTTNEPLCEEGIENIIKMRERSELDSEKLLCLNSTPDVIFVSPMKRCIQTAEILFGLPISNNNVSALKEAFKNNDKYFNKYSDEENVLNFYKSDCMSDFCVVEAFREYDFGEFEGKNHEELMQNETYRKWLECDGAYEMPAGEGLANFKNRVINAFDLTIKECLEKGYKNVVYVVHGGTIMAICEKYDSERKSYYDYMCKNGDCYKAVWTDYLLKQIN